MDLGIYVVYPALYLFGRPKEIVTRASLLSSGVDAGFTSLFVYEDKQVVLTASQGRGKQNRLGDSRGQGHDDHRHAVPAFGHR